MKIQNWQILHVDGRIEERFGACPDLDALQAIVGGPIQLFSHHYLDEHGAPASTPYVCNEEGRFEGLAPNPNSPGDWGCVGTIIRGLEVD